MINIGSSQRCPKLKIQLDFAGAILNNRHKSNKKSNNHSTMTPKNFSNLKILNCVCCLGVKYRYCPVPSRGNATEPKL